MTHTMNGWGQTITVLLSIVTACVMGMRWFDDEIDDLRELIKSIQSKQELFNQKVTGRLSDYGWSREQQQVYINQLRKMADHPVPDLNNGGPSDARTLHGGG